ncbi:MAG: glycerol-3-phosphate 1-O-acyltransferase PlsY [Kiritimatiellia bacterium]
MIINGIISLILAYLLGAIPFGLVIARLRGVDLLHLGSGNIGATNVFRCVGKKWGILTFVFDVLKGIIGTLMPFVAMALWKADFGEHLLLWRILGGAIAMVGHIFPIYIGFKGGKGVSTALGLLLGVAPLSALIGFIVWTLFFFISRYVSLASIVGAATAGALTWILYSASPLWFRILITILSLLTIVKHAKNIVRLCKGTENRFCFTQAQREAFAIKQKKENE